MFLYSLAIFLGAFLLFLVQPLIARYILPWYGGTPNVWTTSLLFFQVLLLGGYSYAYLIVGRLRSSTQAGFHLLLLAGSLLLLPITPPGTWRPQAEQNATWHILAVLTLAVGVPYFVLSATAPLLQAWFHRVRPFASQSPQAISPRFCLILHFIISRFSVSANSWRP